MKAVVFNRKSLPYKLDYCDVNKPVPKDDEVLIKVFSVSLNAIDYRSMKLGMIPKNKIFGVDISGMIESTGMYASKFKPGDHIIGELSAFGFGGLAEFVTAPEKALIQKPAGLSFEEAAALPMAATTALQALRDKAKIKKGQKVLIVGCAGGVGTFAIQLARYFETEVTGVCSPKNIKQSLSLGADYVIDYTKEDFTKKDKKFDIILGINGNYPLMSYRRTLTSTGTYVMVGGSLSQVFKSILFGRILSSASKGMVSLIAKTATDDLVFLARLAEQGVIRPVIDKRYLLFMAPEAMNYIKLGHSTGKVVINLM
jgi:NADPH:quinone reductase-like Zn-dependent oxidoreductase